MFALCNDFVTPEKFGKDSMNMFLYTYWRNNSKKDMDRNTLKYTSN